MKRTSFFRALVLVLFCAFATGLGSLRAQTHNAPPPPQKPTPEQMQAERLKRQTPPPVQSGNTITAVAPDGRMPGNTEPGASMRTSDGSVIRVAPADMEAYKSKPAPVVGTKATKESTDAWMKDFTTWKARNPNYRNTMTPQELEMVDKNNLSALYLYYLHTPTQNANHSRNSNTKP